MRYLTVLLSTKIIVSFSFTTTNCKTFRLTLLKSSNRRESISTSSSTGSLSPISFPAQTDENEDPLERTKKHLEKNSISSAFDQDEEVLYRQYIMKPANALKEELKSLKLESGGRKPDLARRLVDYYTSSKSREEDSNDGIDENNIDLAVPQWAHDAENASIKPLKTFATVEVSHAAGTALARAGFSTPTPIQASALPLITKHKESLILHAETGSGKTLCYLLPITERVWRERDVSNLMSDQLVGENSYALILTPTRELAAQVAGVATCLAPPGSVRLVTTPTNLVRGDYEEKEKSEADFGGRFDNVSGGGLQGTKIIVGSAKSIFLSLYGDSKLYPPTSKPEARNFLSNVKYLVLDEVGKYSYFSFINL
jgi:hypothetical protein